MKCLAAALVLVPLLSAAVVLDRVALVVADNVIKASDIERDIRVTDFLNGDALDFSPAARKQAANRLIDQTLIRREVTVARYPDASADDVAKLLAQVKEERFGTDAAYRAGLEKYGITEAELRRRLSWQLTVLNFVDARFRPGVMVSSEEIQQYFETHRAEFQKAGTEKQVTLAGVRDQIEQKLASARVDRDLFSWLDQARKEANIRYHEAALQ